MAIKLSSGVTVDPLKLVDTRLLIQANSGAGKSWLLRLIVEQAAAAVPVIILDCEGEFSTLRESVDAVLVGPNGEVATDVRSAGLMARKLLQLRLSAVIDLYELKLQDRRCYVRLFLESLMNLPKTLWHPTFIVIDEAHKFCPEKSAGDAESTGAVIDLCSQGRKRGFGAMLATQRLSKLHKDAAAELNNVAIGRTTLDVDQKRALDVLGMSSNQKNELRNLEPGEFLMFGPACDWNEVKRFKSGKPKSTHPQAGKRHEVKPPQPSTAIRKVLGEFSDLPEIAAAEIRDLAAAKKRIGELEREAKARPVVNIGQYTEADMQRAVKAAVAETERTWKGAFTELQKSNGTLIGRLGKIEQLAHLNGDAPAIESPKPLMIGKREIDHITSKPNRLIYPAKPAAPANTTSLPTGEHAILTTAAMYPDGVDRTQLTILTGYKRSSRDAYIQRLSAKGLIDVGRVIVANEAGKAVLGDSYQPLPTGADLFDYWRARLPAGELAVLECAAASYPNAADRDSITDATGYKRSSRDAYIQRLSARKLITTDRDGVTASELLFD